MSIFCFYNHRERERGNCFIPPSYFQSTNTATFHFASPRNCTDALVKLKTLRQPFHRSPCHWMENFVDCTLKGECGCFVGSCSSSNRTARRRPKEMGKVRPERRQSLLILYFAPQTSLVLFNMQKTRTKFCVSIEKATHKLEEGILN